MKKQEKLDIIQKGINETLICRCHFTYDDNYRYYYPNAVNDRFMLGQEEFDFLLDGYCIRKISQIKKVEIKDDKCNEINRIRGLTTEVVMPAVDITSWKTIFESLKALGRFIIIEDELSGKFEIGIIEKVYASKLLFKSFDADGVWTEESFEIPYNEITTVKWATRYTDVWQEYLNSKEAHK